MRVSNQNPFNNNALIKLKNQDWLDKQRIAGRIASKTLLLLEGLVKEKTSLSLLELNKIAEDYIYNAGGTPTFKGYKGFSAGVCISVNKQLVHGIPTNYYLQNGDIVSFDLGVTFDEAIADTAITCIYGEPKMDIHVKLLKITQESLLKGIKAIKIGNRLGCIGNAISSHATNSNFNIITNYGGHGLCWNTPHSAPFVSNKSNFNEGIRIQPGLCIAIEPLLAIGSSNTKTLEDGWTVVTNDVNCHAEHSIFVHNDHVEIITWRENDQIITKPKYYFNENISEF